jgi:hypothetical protein
MSCRLAPGGRHGDFRGVEPERLAISASARSAVFTEAALGNRSAISGSSTITFELSRSRSAYFPRTNAPKSDLLYSDLSSPEFLVLFIKCSLFPCRLPSAYDSNGAVPLSWATTRSPPLDDMPNVTKRLSSNKWSGSSPVAESGSKNALDASSKETPCFLRFPAAFRASHAKRT